MKHRLHCSSTSYVAKSKMASALRSDPHFESTVPHAQEPTFSPEQGSVYVSCHHVD
jgi:hypothetical protein